MDGRRAICEVAVLIWEVNSDTQGFNLAKWMRNEFDCFALLMEGIRTKWVEYLLFSTDVGFICISFASKCVGET